MLAHIRNSVDLFNWGQITINFEFNLLESRLIYCQMRIG